MTFVEPTVSPFSSFESVSWRNTHLQIWCCSGYTSKSNFALFPVPLSSAATLFQRLAVFTLFYTVLTNHLQYKGQCFAMLFSAERRISSKCSLLKMNGSFSFMFVRCVRIMLWFCLNHTIWPCLRGTCCVS